MRRAVSGVADISSVRSKDWETVQIRNVYRTNVPAVGGQRKNQLFEGKDAFTLRCIGPFLFYFRFCSGTI